MDQKWNWKPDRLFGLSYVPPAKHGRTRVAPELLFTLEGDTGQRAEDFIFKHGFYENIGDYLEGQDESWSGHQANLFPRTTNDREFGFDGCGYVIQNDGVTEYHLPLTFETVSQVALTLHLFSHTLRYMMSDAFKTESKSNRAQLLDFTTRCDNHANGGYGHAVSGHIYPALRNWLTRYSQKHGKSGGTIAASERAMRQVYATISHPLARRFAKDCSAHVNAEGRFILVCPGNACDLAIYPEGDNSRYDDMPSDFSCHNLDGACQQLTLMAGLAALHDLALQELG
ncbi:MAG: hypothetical protein JWL82_381 [Parcubacteria group bacterium]|nr:hypothetical protein [Parcubacteria group bacterium]